MTAMLEASPKSRGLRERLIAFLDAHIYPNEARFHEQVSANRWEIPAIVEELKAKARAEKLWNLFLPDSDHGAGLTNLEYAPLCEVMGRSPLAPEVFNCSAPDTGNMEVLARYGTREQQDRWLAPLLDGRIRSCFAMTEPDVASSDATNIRSTIVRDKGDYILNGRKWWISGAGDPRCKIAIFMGLSNPDAASHQRQSMILVPIDTEGVTIERMMTVFGYDDAPHGDAEIRFENVRVPAANLLLGEGRGFEIAQGRLGPGRIHHCMRLIGVAERALATMCARAAHLMDTVGNKAARAQIAMIKVVAPNVALQVLDRAIQAHGAAGVSQDTFLAYAWASARTLRLADGPDEVHLETIAKLELRKRSDQER